MLQGGVVEGRTSLVPRQTLSPLLESRQMWTAENSEPMGRHKSLSQIKHRIPELDQSRRKLCKMNKLQALGKVERPNPVAEDLTGNPESGEPTEIREIIRKILTTGAILT